LEKTYPAFAKCLADLRQLAQRMRHAYFLAGRAQADAALPVEPMRTGAQPGLGEGLSAAVEQRNPERR
jgi:hypothetical protein